MEGLKVCRWMGKRMDGLKTRKSANGKANGQLVEVERKKGQKKKRESLGFLHT
jgi:hypothetical protein